MRNRPCQSTVKKLSLRWPEGWIDKITNFLAVHPRCSGMTPEMSAEDGDCGERTDEDQRSVRPSLP